MGIENCLALQPLTSRIKLSRALRQLEEALLLLENDVSWSFSEIPDISPSFQLLKIENSTLDPLTILDFGTVISQALMARASIAENRETAPTLWEIVEEIPISLKNLAAEIKKTILPTGEISDSASRELNRIRRELNAQRGRLTKLLESIMRTRSDAVRDELVTIRNDRYVIPIKSEFGGRIKGVAHGASSSGATLFVEPLDSIEANNALQSLRAKEESEIARILFSLASQLRENLYPIKLANDAIGELDLIKAKILFAQKFDAIVPEITEELSLELRAARHPLLEENLRNAPDAESNKIVPVSISLTEKDSVMVISGANAGGKTVVLKTAGLLSLIAISGLPVPAESARVPFYASILADIGDHQSLSANLSTFSSHISNIAAMMSELHNPALVLLDEVGTGTDPDEGSALGVAIVDYFRKQGAQIIASTHYKGLKIYAANDENVINASVAFDQRTLQPTYELILGMAGASSGLEIARRFGIREDVVEFAREKLDDASRDSENYLQKLQSETKQATDLRIALEEERTATAQKYASLDVEFRKHERKRKREFERSLSKTIEDFERMSKTFLKTVEDKKRRKKYEQDLLASKAELKRQAFKKIQQNEADAEINKVKSGNEIEKDKPNETKIISGKIEAGSNVRLKTLGSTGIVEKIDQNRADVLIGSMRMRVPLVDLELIATTETQKNDGKKRTRRKPEPIDIEDRENELSTELYLIGQTAVDAQMEVDRFLDQAYLSKLSRIRIIHGFGTGTLRNAVHQTLKGHTHVKSFEFAPQNEGGNGATIVKLNS